MTTCLLSISYKWLDKLEGFFNLLCSVISLLPVVFRMMHKIVLMLGFNFFRAHMKVSEKAHTVKMTKGFYQHLKLSFFPLQKYLRTHIWFLFSFFSSSCCLLMNVKKNWYKNQLLLNSTIFVFIWDIYFKFVRPCLHVLNCWIEICQLTMRATLSDIVPYSWLLLHTMWFMR